MAAEDVDNQRLQAALDAALDELDSDNEEVADEKVQEESRPLSAGTHNEASPEVLLERFMEQMVANGNEDEFIGKVMGEMEAHLLSTVAQQERSGEIPSSAVPSNKDTSAPIEEAKEPSSQQHTSSSKRKHTCEPPPRKDLDAVIGNLFQEIAHQHETLDRAAAVEGANFTPPDMQDDDSMMQNLMKELEGLNTDDLDTDSVIDGMMEQLLAKDLMYQPMKQVAERFPSWLQANKSKLSDSEYIEYVM